MIVKPLNETSIDVIIDCFLQAFENYFVPLPTDKAYYKSRWKAAGVNFSLSYGMFDDDTLVGFILHAVDHRFGILTAYNTGTGVIPTYRGQRVVKSIYEFALKDLKHQGIRKSTLEVITENVKAIKAYEGIGFKICKTYKCFNGGLNLPEGEDVNLREVDLNNVVWEDLPNQTSYSWDNQKETLLNGDYQFYYVLTDGSPESYFIIKPDTNYIAQCGVLNNEYKSWNRLFLGIKHVTDSVKINNVNDVLYDKLKYFNSIGLNNVVDQYEMELDL